MDWTKQCVAVIPCLNEAAAIASVIAAVRLQIQTVIVVDDGSADRTAACAEAAGALVLRNPTALGKGASLRQGWQKAKEAGFGWALSLDGDGQHSAADIPAFFQCATQTAADLVIGDRTPDPSGMPRLRRLVNGWMSRRMTIRTGRFLPDSQCGFRLMNLGVWSSLVLRTDHFEIESEVLLAFLKAGRKVEFVPIRTIYKNERSKIHPLRDTVRWFRWWWSNP